MALATNGPGVNVTRLMVFCLSAFLAGVAGALFIAASGKAGGRGFPALNSLLWLTVLVICGSAVIRSSVMAAAVLAVAPSYLPSSLVVHQSMIFGILATGAAILVASGIRLPRPATERMRRSPAHERATGGRPLGAVRPTPGLLRIRALLPGAEVQL